MLTLLLLACGEKIMVTSILAGTATDGHYIVINDDGKVFDCMSRPDGENWEPTCIAVEYHNHYDRPEERRERSDDKR